jgi:UDP-N-acetylmuramyl pentapeptide phosphotransferase/UDP-N-acetylglucosamine-1-phosphate transferase
VTRRRRRGPLLTVAASAAAAWAASRAARHLPRPVGQPWERTNHAGSTVTLLEGPAFVVGALAGAALATSVRPTRPAQRAAVVVAALAAGSLGALDDLAGGTADKGLRGHLAALRRGEVTTGAVKVVGLAATGLVAAALSDLTGHSDAGSRPRGGVLATLVGGAVVAGAANAANLFDLRPGRALKVTVAAAAPLVRTPAGAAALGASLGVVGDDLAARSMLGDTGANAAGALVGLAVVERCGLAGRVAALAGLTALTLASERVSFTRVIEGNRVLRAVDEWGRSPR